MQDLILKSLDVCWNGRLVGRYDKFDSGSEQFTYDAEYLSSGLARPISRSLPLRQLPFSGPELRPFFAGLLPEEAQRSRIASYLGIAETNDFAFLEVLGGECAGALTIVPHGSLRRPSQGGFEAKSETELAALIEMLPLRPLLVGERGLRLSLAGAQSKLPVVVRDGQIGLPLGDAPSTHILKPELSPWFKDIALNEYCCMTLARHLKLAVPQTKFMRIGKYPCLLVERYDRKVDAATGCVVRIHQEDFCQALGWTPEQKYQMDGGPLVREIVRLIRSGWSTAPALDVLSFIDLLMFNAIIGNADAHGKNYSMLYHDDGARRLAPGYDLVSTVFWPALAKSPAMKIGGNDSVDSICYGHWKRLAAELNLGLAQLLQRVKHLCRGVIDASCEKLLLPPECAPVLDLVRARARRIFQEASLKD